MRRRAVGRGDQHDQNDHHGHIVENQPEEGVDVAAGGPIVAGVMDKGLEVRIAGSAVSITARGETRYGFSHPPLTYRRGNVYYGDMTCERRRLV